MSHAKTVRICKDRVIKRLDRLEMRQKDLADMIGWNYQALNRALSRGEISEGALDLIGRCLDLAPEYLSGMPLFEMGSREDDEDFYSYDFHVSQLQPPRNVVVTSLLWRMAGMDPATLSPDVYWGLWERVSTAADEYIEAYKKGAAQGGHGTP